MDYYACNGGRCFPAVLKAAATLTYAAIFASASAAASTVSAAAAGAAVAMLFKSRKRTAAKA